MKTKLEELNVDQFVSLLDGDGSVLLNPNESVGQDTLTKTMRNIIFEYKEIADKAGFRSYLREKEDILKTRISIKIFTCCDNLLKLNEYEAVRDILKECGIRISSNKEERLRAEVKSRLNRALNTLKKIDEELRLKAADSKDVNIRHEFDGQTASLMAHYKFQIDTSTMKATIYAQLLARYQRELKAQLAAMKK